MIDPEEGVIGNKSQMTWLASVWEVGESWETESLTCGIWIEHWVDSVRTELNCRTPSVGELVDMGKNPYSRKNQPVFFLHYSMWLLHTTFICLVFWDMVLLCSPSQPLWVLRLQGEFFFPLGLKQGQISTFNSLSNNAIIH
jgi:hypothetical protein